LNKLRDKTYLGCHLTHPRTIPECLKHWGKSWTAVVLTASLRDLRWTSELWSEGDKALVREVLKHFQTNGM